MTVEHCQKKYFNPRSPHGERRLQDAADGINSNFNPRSPHGERLCLQQTPSGFNVFQSTLPAWGATLLTTDPFWL